MKGQTILIVCLCLLSACCGRKLSDQKVFYPGPTGERWNRVRNDLFIGTLEAKILEQFGRPVETYSANALEFGDDLKYELRNKVSFGAKVKKLVFPPDPAGVIRSFWFVEGTDGIWRVVADRSTPGGVVF